MNYTSWIIYGGILSAVGLSLLAVLMLAWAKHFVPQSVHMSWAEWPILLALSVPGGLMVGGWLGYQLEPLSTRDRAWLLADVFIMVTIMLVSQWLLRKVWSEPDAQSKFMPALLWQLTPLMPMCIYYYWLRHLIR